jgi:hypothetical protein
VVSGNNTPEYNSWDVLQVSTSAQKAGAHAPPIVRDNENRTKGKQISENKSESAIISPMIEPKIVAHCLQTTRSENYINTNSGNEPTDRRVITRGEMKAKVEGYEDLRNDQRSRLLMVLTKYQSNLTKRPGKCAGFEYHFKIVGKVPFKDDPICIT